MNFCAWKEVDGFRSLLEFRELESWIEKQVQLGEAHEIDVRRPFSGLDFQEKWFQQSSSGKIWRLVAPEPPFLGVFEEIQEKTSDWKRIRQFNDYKDFQKFESWMMNEIKLGKAEAIVRKPCYDGDTSHQGKWFRHLSSGEIWRLEIPQGDFKGSFFLIE